MKRCAGFTIIELLVVVAILGILAATAMPLYNTWEQRAYGSEAALMVKKILDGQIMYYLENEKFYPDPGNTIEVYHDGTQKLNGVNNPTVIQDALNALAIKIPIGHFLDFQITNIPGLPSACQIVVNHYGNRALFKNGATTIIGDLDNTGKINISFL